MQDHDTCSSNKGEAYDLSQDVPINPSSSLTFGDLISRRYGRRDVLKGMLATTAISTLLGPHTLVAGTSASATEAAHFHFDEIAHGVDDTHHVAPGYKAAVLIRWGDPVTADAPPFDPSNQTPEAQEKQFGYNNDFLAYLPLPLGSDNAEHGLLFVNHEYTNEELMFPGLGPQDKKTNFAGMTQQLVDIEMSAHGASIIEVKKINGIWQVVSDSPHGRRISARTTVMRLSGPAAGHARLQTSADPSGTRVIGMLNNCAGGVTPWGTVLTCEENFHGYFMGTLAGHAEERNYKRYGVPDGWYAWGRFYDRFDINKEPNEANRFGWVVEIDPYDPTSLPVKRTALGRFKHEGATTIVNKDGRLVLYSGDDERFEYLYKYVSQGRVDRDNRANNAHILDQGTLFVAKFHDDGSLEWLPLVWGDGPLTEANDFRSQADVLIETRRAADLLGATPMDRPEDVETHPLTHKVYVMLTNNSRRKSEQVNAANPRANNVFGHIIEITPADSDHTAQRARWEILVKCGDPRVAEVGALFHPATSANGWFASPDNCAIDHQGRLWIATDQGNEWSQSGTTDGVWAMETEGPRRGLATMFFRVPIGAELCGPLFTPDDKTLFVAVQHPAADGTTHYPGFKRVSTYDDPATRWPDFQATMPPRPAVLAITKDDGGVIGS
jgi:uncharacterized protein